MAMILLCMFDKENTLITEAFVQPAYEKQMVECQINAFSYMYVESRLCSRSGTALSLRDWMSRSRSEAVSMTIEGPGYSNTISTR